MIILHVSPVADCQMEIAVLLDSSQNIGKRRFSLKKRFLNKLAVMLSDGTDGPHLGVVQTRWVR